MTETDIRALELRMLRQQMRELSLARRNATIDDLLGILRVLRRGEALDMVTSNPDRS
jgi:hypothetical protein